jgi:hypothetical protein
MGTQSKTLPTKNRRGLVIRPSGIPRTPLLDREEVLRLVAVTRQGNRKQRRHAMAILRRYNVCFEARYKAVRRGSESTVTPDELVGTIIPTEDELDGHTPDETPEGESE